MEAHRHIAELLGGYVLNAVDGHERDAVERHLAGCGACLTEVTEYRQVVAALTSGGPAPLGAWDRIAAALEDPPPPLHLAPVVPLRRGPSRTTRLLTAMTAAAAVTVAVLGLRLVDQERRLDRMEAVAAEDGLRRSAHAALANPGSRTLQLASAELPVVAQAAILADGRSYLLADQLPRLQPDRTYQLWVLVDDDRVSAGILGTRPTVAAFHVGQRLDGLAITEERSGGVVESQNSPTVYGRG